MDTNKMTFHITGGPSRERLFDHLKYLYEEYAPIVPVKFSTWTEGVSAKVIGVRIDAIQHADHTGYSFIIGGTCLVETVNETEDVFSQHKFCAKYNARKRKGNMELLS